MDAVLVLLVEVGYAGLTIEGVAEKAGVAKTTVYRRWPSKASLVVALGKDVAASKVRVPDTGTVRGDASALLRNVIKTYTKTVVGRVIPGLIADMAENSDLAEAARGYLGTRRIMIEILQRGISRGELRPDIDLELTADLMYGPLAYRFLITGAPLNARLADKVVDAALLGSAPRA